MSLKHEPASEPLQAGHGPDGGEPLQMAPRTDRTTRIPSGVASPLTTNHAAKGSVFVNLRNPGNLDIATLQAGHGRDGGEPLLPQEVTRVLCEL